MLMIESDSAPPRRKCHNASMNSGAGMRRGSTAVFLVWLCGIGAAAEPQYLSPCAIVADKAGATLYVAEATAKQVAVCDTRSCAVRRTFALPGEPSGLALSPDGARLYVTGNGAAGQVYAIDLASGTVSTLAAAGHTPMAPVVSVDGLTLYVCNRFNNEVAAIDIRSGKCVARIPVPREPVAAARTGRGRKLVVANHLPAYLPDDPYPAARATIIDLARTAAVAHVLLPQGSMGVRGVCVSPNGRHAYVTHTLARFQVPTTQLERGWMNTSALSILDLESNTLVNTVLLDDVDAGAANPWGVACSADGLRVYVAHAGSGELSIIDRVGMHDKLAKVAAGTPVSPAPLAPADVPNDLSFLVDVRTRLKLKGIGPRNVAVVGSTVYVTEYFSDSLGVVRLATNAPAATVSAALGPRQTLTGRRKGEMLFNSAAICFQHWQSCATCHPDARADALNWDLLNDGMGNPRQTKSMLLVAKTPPMMITGIRDDMSTAVRSGMKYIQFAVRPEEEAAAIDEYLASLTPVPSPRLANGALSPAAERGKKMFAKAGCAACHTAPLYTNLKQYDVDLGSGVERGRKFDTPTLVECWRTAPYLFDGRAHTMKEVLTDCNRGDKHGTTSTLSPGEIDDLAEFVLSL